MYISNIFLQIRCKWR